jgi:outer membrane protein assembly factor BamB
MASEPVAATTVATPPADDRVEAMVRDVDERYVIGLRPARQLGYRVDWQSDVTPTAGTQILRIDLEDDSVFVLDDENFLSRLRREDGAVIWRIPIADPIQQVMGLNFLPELERVYVTLGGSLLVLDAATGAAVGRQKLAKAAATEPVLYGPFMIYGARNGQLVWHSHRIAFQADAYQISGSIALKPVRWGSEIIAVGGGGRIRLLNAGSATSLWWKNLLDDVVAEPRFGDGIVYIAGLDQYLYAIDTASGRTRWSRLTTSPLRTSPAVLGDQVYQQIPGEGLTCFDAMSFDDFNGRIIWQSANIEGTVLMQRGTDLLVWNEQAKEMDIVDPARGGVIATVALPAVERLVITSDRDGELYAQASDGRVSRLVPRN